MVILYMLKNIPDTLPLKRTVLRIVKAAESTYFYCFTNLLSAMVKKGKQNQTFDALVITFWAVRYRWVETRLLNRK